ncbi:ABC transporter substrate-binding protein [Frateuria aurantia]
MVGSCGQRVLAWGWGALAALAVAPLAATTLTIGTVNNADMVRMQALTPDYEASHPGVKLHWVVLEENTLRQRLTTDIATGSGQFDVMTIGAYETPLWGSRHWLSPLDHLPADYGVDDLLPNVRAQLTENGHLYALPFYAEASITFYRKDLFKAHGLEMPATPSWQQIRTFADQLNDPEHGVYGICLRGKAGWGENMAIIGSMANAFGGRYFDMQWQPQFDTPPWHQAVRFYVDMLRKDGPPGVSANGFNESLALFAAGKCALWVDASVAGGVLTDRKQSQVADTVGFTRAPHAVTDRGSSWQYIWSLAVPVSSRQQAAATEFIAWATSRAYRDLVASRDGLAASPPGTRLSTYQNPAYMQQVPFAKVTLDSLLAVDPVKPTLLPVPYKGIQFATIPEFQAIGSLVGREISGVLAGRGDVDEVLRVSQQAVTRTMRRAGYYQAASRPATGAQ